MGLAVDERWGPQLTVVVHNPLRPWGESPLHDFYRQVQLREEEDVSSHEFREAAHCFF